MTVSIDRIVPVEDRFIVFLRLFSVLFSINLSEKEIEVINEFYWRHGGVINTDTRKAVAKRLDMSEFNLNNYLGKLRKRKVVSQNNINEKININIMAADKTLNVLFNLIS